MLAERAVGVDQSAAMLALARAHSHRGGLGNVQLRQGDIYAPPVERDAFDLVVMHQVLHFLDDPPRAIGEAARALRPGGRLLVVDFMTHEEELLRQDYAHRRLGFNPLEIEACLREAGLAMIETEQIPPAPGEAGKLTVVIWLARDTRLLAAERADAAPRLTPEIA